MPFTANRQFKARPRLLASASGMHYRDVDGNEVLDATAGLWCCNAGHARPRIVEAVKQQVGTLDFAPNFSMSSPLPFKLAERLAALAPGDLNKVFFSNSGSEAVDSALKIALAYHRARGEGHDARRPSIQKLDGALLWRINRGAPTGQRLAALAITGAQQPVEIRGTPLFRLPAFDAGGPVRDERLCRRGRFGYSHGSLAPPTGSA